MFKAILDLFKIQVPEVKETIPKLEGPNTKFSPAQIVDYIQRRIKNGEHDWKRMLVLARQNEPDGSFSWYTSNLTLIQTFQLLKDYIALLSNLSQNPDYELYHQRIGDDLERLIVLVQKSIEKNAPDVKFVIDTTRV